MTLHVFCFQVTAYRAIIFYISFQKSSGGISLESLSGVLYFYIQGLYLFHHFPQYFLPQIWKFLFYKPDLCWKKPTWAPILTQWGALKCKQTLFLPSFHAKLSYQRLEALSSHKDVLSKQKHTALPEQHCTHGEGTAVIAKLSFVSVHWNNKY